MIGGLRRRAPSSEAGAVVAEFAIALPAIAIVVLFVAAALGAGAQQVRLQDAAADAARLAGRGESEARVLGVVTEVGGTATISHDGDRVCVTASAPSPVSALIEPLSAMSCALDGRG